MKFRIIKSQGAYIVKERVFFIWWTWQESDAHHNWNLYFGSIEQAESAIRKYIENRKVWDLQDVLVKEI